MPAQLRIDQARRVGGTRLVLEYSHHITALPVLAMGYGQAWSSVADLRDNLIDLRQFLQRPETMMLLAVLGVVAADPSLTSLATLPGKLLTFDHTSLTTPLVIG